MRHSGGASSSVAGASFAPLPESLFAQHNNSGSGRADPPVLPSFAALSNDHFKCSCPLDMLRKDIERCLAAHDVEFELSEGGARYECDTEDLSFDLSVFATNNRANQWVVEFQHTSGSRFAFSPLLNALSTAMRYCSQPLRTARFPAAPPSMDIPLELLDGIDV